MIFRTMPVAPIESSYREMVATPIFIVILEAIGCQKPEESAKCKAASVWNRYKCKALWAFVHNFRVDMKSSAKNLL